MTPTLAMINQLITYCNDVERQGWYYGDKEQFRARHKKIVQWLEQLLKEQQ